jgi:hypothetical protein
MDDLGATILFQLGGARCERRSIIPKWNRSYGDWGSILADPTAATASLGRLLRRATTIRIRVETYRSKDRRRAALLAPGAEDGQPSAGARFAQNGPQGAAGAGQSKSLLQVLRAETGNNFLHLKDTPLRLGRRAAAAAGPRLRLPEPPRLRVTGHRVWADAGTVEGHGGVSAKPDCSA